MKRPDLHNALQVLTNVGVIVSIVFLAVEIRQNSALMELEQLQASTANRIAVYTLQTNPDLADVIGRSYVNAGEDIELQASEGVMLEGYLFSYLEIIQSRYIEYEKGLLDQEQWERDGFLIEPVLSAPWGRRWWDEFKHTFYKPPFVSAVDQILESSTESYPEKFKRVGAKEQ